MSGEEKKLADFGPDAEALVDDRIAKALRERLAPLADEVENLKKRMDAASELLAQLGQDIGDAKEGAEYRAQANEIAKAIRELIAWKKEFAAQGP